MAFEVKREKLIADLGTMIMLRAVETADGKRYVDLRKYFRGDDGAARPTSKGIMLSVEKWQELSAQSQILTADIVHYFENDEV